MLISLTTESRYICSIKIIYKSDIIIYFQIPNKRSYNFSTSSTSYEEFCLNSIHINMCYWRVRLQYNFEMRALSARRVRAIYGTSQVSPTSLSLKIYSFEYSIQNSNILLLTRKRDFKISDEQNHLILYFEIPRTFRLHFMYK